jgi:hypothetical protein
MYIIPDIIVNYLIPYTSYFDLVDTLKAFGFDHDSIEQLRQIEYNKRLTSLGRYLGMESYFHHKEHCIEYYIENKLHNENSSAINRSWGDTEWYYNGKKHRDDGPAACISDVFGPRSVRYYKHGLKHRLDGPADINHIASDCTIYEWWENGKRLATYEKGEHINTPLAEILKIKQDEKNIARRTAGRNARRTIRRNAKRKEQRKEQGNHQQTKLDGKYS